MVRIRLRRIGLKHQPSYRIVVADKESPRDGRFLEILGFYNPRTDPFTLQIHEDRLYEWLGKGAQPSESATRILTKVGAMDRFARYKAGEPLEKLMDESKTALEAREAEMKIRKLQPVH